MDGRRFDALSTWLVTGSSRRATLRALVAGAFASGLGGLVLQVDDAAAKCASIGKKCKKKHGKNKKCCSGAKCRGKRCQCANGQENSGGVCGTRPTCFPHEQVCSDGDQCCSGSCSDIMGCARGAPGKPCFEDDDCFLNDICVGFVCTDVALE